jgi:hypothetical protein
VQNTFGEAQKPVHTLIDLFYRIEPGVLIALLGAEALIITLIPPKILEKNLAVKITAAIVCFALLVGEIRIIKHDREETAKQHRDEMKDVFGRFADCTRAFSPSKRMRRFSSRPAACLLTTSSVGLSIYRTKCCSTW